MVDQTRCEGHEKNLNRSLADLTQKFPLSLPDFHSSDFLLFNPFLSSSIYHYSFNDNRNCHLFEPNLPLTSTYIREPFLMAVLLNPLIVPLMRVEVSYASEVLPVPSQTRSKRSDGSSTDESPSPGPGGFVETDSRAGGPTLCEAPCETIARVPPNHQHYQSITGVNGHQLRMRLIDICRDRKLSLTDSFFGDRCSSFEPAQDTTFTLIVHAERTDTTSGAWLDPPVWYSMLH
ncbi:hypothetical protein BJY01DRAFT_245145 [Aspergillus pseudoustus]|uniref:Uncharacterized protein n=1 Tax=Aspergillus pseudoustus TaxID=1810923 RepID=A0ABR4KFK3_9EURO